MADFTLDGFDPTPETTSTPVVGPADTTEQNDSVVLGQTGNNNNGLSQEEISDPNAIKITIDDPTTPIVVLFGPPASGKTMTLIRLTRYLTQHGYEVAPVKTFRPSYDSHYSKICDGFNNMVNSDEAAKGTDNISFMLVKVLQKGKPICQILEAPGEGYYLPKADTGIFPKYVNNVINNKNRKIWLFVVEPDWLDEEDRQGYAAKIKKLSTRMHRTDKVIFLCNKIDKTPFVQGSGLINTNAAQTAIKNQYKGIFESFHNENPITRFFSEYRCRFIPFSTGDYNERVDGGISYEAGDDYYPRRLWNEILSIRRG